MKHCLSCLISSKRETLFSSLGQISLKVDKVLLRIIFPNIKRYVDVFCVETFLPKRLKNVDSVHGKEKFQANLINQVFPCNISRGLQSVEAS